jgi:hypothetical protein
VSFQTGVKGEARQSDRVLNWLDPPGLGWTGPAALNLQVVYFKMVAQIVESSANGRPFSVTLTANRLGSGSFGTASLPAANPGKCGRMWNFADNFL